jgi:hypothetical protein
MLRRKMILIDVSGLEGLIAPWTLKHAIRHNDGFRDDFFRDYIALRQKDTFQHQIQCVAHFKTYAVLLCKLRP